MDDLKHVATKTDNDDGDFSEAITREMLLKKWRKNELL